MGMHDEYDFTGGKRGVFYRPGQPKRFVIALDHVPHPASFEISQNENDEYTFSLKLETGEVAFSRGPFRSREEALQSIEDLRESVIAAETIGV